MTKYDQTMCRKLVKRQRANETNNWFLKGLTSPENFQGRWYSFYLSFNLFAYKRCLWDP